MLINLKKTVIIEPMKKKRVILEELKNLLRANFGNDIESVILFGSRASGEAHKNSDYDVLIVLNRIYDREYRLKITSVVLEMELKYDIFIDTKLISSYELYHTIKGKVPLYVDAIEQGIHA
jgi:predicted nucleotidyltransferase